MLKRVPSSRMEVTLWKVLNPINGGVKVSQVAEQVCTTGVVYSRAGPGCQYSVLAIPLGSPG